MPDMLTPEMIKYLDDADDWVKRFDDLAEPLGWQFSQLYRRSSVMHLAARSLRTSMAAIWIDKWLPRKGGA